MITEARYVYPVYRGSAVVEAAKTIPNPSLRAEAKRLAPIYLDLVKHWRGRVVAATVA